MLTKLTKFLIRNQLYQNIRFLSVSCPQSNKNIAVVLSGCGVYDGTEITEAVSVMVHLSRNNANISFFAPNINQLHVINHATGEVESHKRNVLQEAARITRGNIQSLEKLNAADFNGMIVPGGFGAAKNLSDFAVNGLKFTVNQEMERVIKDFTNKLKPIGLCCIAPVLPVKTLPGCKVTVGKQASDTNKDWPYAGTIESLKLLGASVEEKDVSEITIDDKYKIISTPAFMKNASFFEVYTGIGLMVDEVIKQCN